MKNTFDVSKLEDYTEKTWFLGTNIVKEQDLTLMEDKIGTSFSREEGAIYHVGVIEQFPSHYKELGYSKQFQEIIKEAHNRGYAWIFYDRDIES